MIALLFLWTLCPLAGLVLANSLIAGEFRQKTQLFLEGLPLPRWEMALVKYALGLAVMLLAASGVLIASWWLGRGSEAMTPRFAAMIFLKSFGWIWFVYALSFAIAFLGRYRATVWILLLMIFMFLYDARVEVSAFGPFRLVDMSFPYERQAVPWDALAITIAGISLLSAFGFGCAVVRDGGIAELLAERMSSREKVAVTMIVVCAMGLVTYLQKHMAHATFVQIPGAYEESRKGALVYATAAVDVPTVAEAGQVREVARSIANELDHLSAYLGGDSLPQSLSCTGAILLPTNFKMPVSRFPRG